MKSDARPDRERHDPARKDPVASDTSLSALWARHGNKVLLVITAACLALFAVRYRAGQAAERQSQTKQALAEAWSAVEQLPRLTSGPASPELDKARIGVETEINQAVQRVVDDTEATPTQAAWAWLARGEMYWTLAHATAAVTPTTAPATGPSSQPVARSTEQTLDLAAKAYGQVVADYAGVGVPVNVARFSLAAVAEERHDLAAARSQYKALIETAGLTEADKKMATVRLGKLDAMDKPVLLLPATQPAVAAITADALQSLISPMAGPMSLGTGVAAPAIHATSDHSTNGGITGQPAGPVTDADDQLPPDAAVDADPDAEAADAEVADDGLLRVFKYTLGKNLTRRIDQYLVDRIGYLSRNAIQGLINDGLVKVNGKTTKCSYRPREHDIVDVAAPPKMSEQLVPEDIPLDVLFEDDYMMALNKQANLVVHPARGQWTGTLVNGLAFYGKKWSSLNGDVRPGILHRLDKNTTGVILIAKVDEAHWRLARQFENRTIQKSYLALAHGIPALLQDEINMPIGQDRYVREKQAVRKVENGGREAVTQYKVLESYETPAGQTSFRFQASAFANDRHFKTPGGRFSLISLHPKTGRTHQLRVHLSHLGMPIVGDTMYGGQAVVESAPDGEESPFTFVRQALHAAEITFTHPISLEPMTITAPLPADIRRLITLVSTASGKIVPPAASTL